ncbi:MAG: 1-acyl-sn-glycerol-3-phosphate acyltransferase [Sneathiella sp.]|jgi:1-acyl-sn-glycerol-3-phosphate acyltransferase|uniref:lysophospholipid acyltransferase family protein n=1 Tax=Sneathiella sp. TaxID=1964365 RepID=UPI000C455811|nr:lysophospholipid acyltransferase family protein [Sneathiella sp.]MAL79074.1 1-acyl-sn-glycerol-3-phosphate acyltransferase [Sneathiella sp.]|tara:strand:+ start:1711 stop:2520 length:810 start_codon:yes stop_codon:yes gene_type:complete
MNKIKATLTILAIFIWAGLLAPVQMIILLFFKQHRYCIPRIFHKGLCRLLRVKVVTSGTIEKSRPTLFVLNHISWLDIPVIGSALHGSFVAKREVESYPLIGPISKLQQTIFIERSRPAIKGHKGEMQEHLEKGDNLFLFPEGTSSNGIIIQSFKSAYFGLAERKIGDRHLPVQPVTLAYSRMNGIPLTRGTMGIVAWVGDEELLSHVWEYLKRGKITAELRFHPPVTIDDYDSRKTMASDCQMTIAKSLSRALTGRDEPERPESRTVR